ncbi:hypothetical protein TEA_020772 [Camellia sinensis var. sinensis]|uniref:Pentatricopeptide repeat-containing protein n=1 Tax=Camellia sinensis var. sinensis TaxID=542762 RepID=A0A4S4E0N3_CAMSN|nr:hypothetical protein TEA_020772 [Camellia sinensis var. sinensis]
MKTIIYAIQTLMSMFAEGLPCFGSGVTLPVLCSSYSSHGGLRLLRLIRGAFRMSLFLASFAVLFDKFECRGSVIKAFVGRSDPMKVIRYMDSSFKLVVNPIKYYSRDTFDLFNGIHQMHMGVDNVILCSMLNISMGNTLVDMFSKSGEIEDAKHAFNKMGQKNVISWTSLIVGSGKHGISHVDLTNEASQCFNNMVGKYNILPMVEHYSCMVDLFARGGQFKEADILIHEMNIKPNASIWGGILGACNICGDMPLGEVAARHLFNIEPEKSVNYVVLASIYATVGLWDSV